MGFNNARYWSVRRDEVKSRYLNFKEEFNELKKFTMKKFNYNVGLQKKIVDQMIETLNDNGLYQEEIIKRFTKQSGFLVKDSLALLYQRNGETRTIELWMLERMLETFNFQIELKYVGKSKFTHSIQESGGKRRLILETNHLPKMQVNLNLNDYYDFEVDLFKKGVSEYKAKTLFRQMNEYYFIQIAKGRKVPFKMKIAFDLFKEKYYRDEMNNKP